MARRQTEEVVLTDEPQSTVEYRHEVMTDHSKQEAPVIPAPDVQANVQHPPGTRSVAELMNEFVHVLAVHADCKILDYMRGPVPKIAPGEPDLSQGFEGTPVSCQHTMTLRISYRDTVTNHQPASPVEEGLTPFERKWGKQIAKAGREARERNAGLPPPVPEPNAHDHLLKNLRPTPAAKG